MSFSTYYRLVMLWIEFAFRVTVAVPEVGYLVVPGQVVQDFSGSHMYYTEVYLMGDTSMEVSKMTSKVRGRELSVIVP